MENKGFKFFKKGSAFLIAPALFSSFLPGASASTVGGAVASKAASESFISKLGSGTVNFLSNHWGKLLILAGIGVLTYLLLLSNKSDEFSELGEKVNGENRLATRKDFEETFWHLFNVKDKMTDMEAANAPFDFFAIPEKDEENGGKLVPQSMGLGNEIILFVRKNKDGEDGFSNGEPSKEGLYSGTDELDGNAWVSLTIGYLKDFEKRAKEHLKGLLKNPNDWYEIERNASNKPPELWNANEVDIEQDDNINNNENNINNDINIDQYNINNNKNDINNDKNNINNDINVEDIIVDIIKINKNELKEKGTKFAIAFIKLQLMDRGCKLRKDVDDIIRRQIFLYLLNDPKDNNMGNMMNNMNGNNQNPPYNQGMGMNYQQNQGPYQPQPFFNYNNGGNNNFNNNNFNNNNFNNNNNY